MAKNWLVRSSVRPTTAVHPTNSVRRRFSVLSVSSLFLFAIEMLLLSPSPKREREKDVTKLRFAVVDDVDLFWRIKTCCHCQRDLAKEDRAK